MRIAIFITCLGENFYPRSAIAAVKVLEHLGHRVEFPAAQTCCGQPMFNNGFHDVARDLARRMIEVFGGFEAVVTPSGSCAAMIREQYQRLFEGDPVWGAKAQDLASRTFEFVEFLVSVLKIDPAQLGVRWEGDVAYHYSCHLRGLGLAGQAESLLQQVPGVRLVQLKGAEQCCGFGGLFSVKYPQISASIVGEKVASLRATGCPTVACNEPGCSMNIEGACRREGHSPRFLSVAEILAEGLGLIAREGAS